MIVFNFNVVYLQGVNATLDFYSFLRDLDCHVPRNNGAARKEDLWIIKAERD